MTGLAYAWLIAFPVLPLVTFLQARSKLGIGTKRLAAAIAPGLFASFAMALVVSLLGHGLAALAAWQRLVLEIGFGGAAYLALLLAFSRETLAELAGLVLRRRSALAATAAV